MKWIKHDADANQDAKLQNVLLDYGLEGYGLYWYCIELIAGKVDKDNITFELEHDARIIARATGSTPQKVEEMMRYFVKIGLFENSQGVITCLKLAKRLDKSMTSNPEMRQIIERLKSKNHDSVMTQSEKPMQDKIRLDQSNNIDQQADLLPLSQEEKQQKPDLNKAFDMVWKYWHNKVGKEAGRRAFLKTFKSYTREDLIAEMEHIEAYREYALNQLQSKNNAYLGFNAIHFATFINQKRWLDLTKEELGIE